MQSEASGNMSPRAGLDERIERCVQFALHGTSSGRTHDERRRQKRHPFPYPVQLTPVNVRREITGEPIVVLGKHLSNQGFDFYFQHPVSHRRVIARFNFESPERVELLMDLTWCRFNRHGWYENGGRFLAPANLPATERLLSIVTHVETAASSVNELHV